MTERVVVDCDKCGKETKSHIKIRIPQGSQRTGPSGYPETDYLFETRDLCTKCVESLLKFMLSHRRFLHKETKQIELRNDRGIHPEGNQETDVILLARKYFGIKEP
jgi:hypothetical protein